MIDRNYSILIQLLAENIRSQRLYLVFERVLGCELDVRKGGAVEGDVLPGGDLHGDAAEDVEPEILEPGVDDVGVGVPGLDSALVNPALKVFLGLFMGKGAADDGPEGALGGEEDGACDGDGEGGGGVAGKVEEDVEQRSVVGPHMDARHRDPVCPCVLQRPLQADTVLHIVPDILHNIANSKRPQHGRRQDSIALSSHARIYCQPSPDHPHKLFPHRPCQRRCSRQCLAPSPRN